MSEIYYLKPEFKMQSLIVPFILLVPIGFIIGHIIKGDAENFQNKHLENAVVIKHENKIIATDDDDDDDDDWDIMRYVNNFKKYIQKTNIIYNDNGNKSINLRYNIE